ncbi:hypothetical protein D3C77_536820 [compost metagenome]
MYGSILLAKLGQDSLLQDISNYTIHEKFVRLPQDRLEFAVVDRQGNQVRFIPLFRVEEEQYTVYLDLKGDSLQDSCFAFAKDGSSAYEET